VRVKLTLRQQQQQPTAQTTQIASAKVSALPAPIEVHVQPLPPPASSVPAAPVNPQAKPEPVSAPAPVKPPVNRETFLNDVLRETQESLEVSFAEACRNLFPDILPPDFGINYRKMDCPPFMQDMLARLEDYARHSCLEDKKIRVLLLKALLVFGENERALELAELLGAQGNSGFMYYHALILFQLGRFHDAETLSGRLVKGKIGMEARLLQLISLAKTGKITEAGHSFVELIPQITGRAGILRLALPWLCHARELDALLETVKILIASASVDSSPGDRALLRDLIQDLYADEEYRVIAELYKPSLPLQAGFNTDDWYRFAIALAYLEREDEARAACMRSLGLNEMPATWTACLDIFRASGRADKAIYPLVARNFLIRGDPLACLAFCNALPASAMSSRLSLIKARCLIQTGSCQEALALLEKLEYDHRVYGERQYLEGCVYFYSGKKKEACDYFRNAAESGICEKDCWRFLGDIYAEEGAHEQAADYYKRVARFSESDPEPVMLYAYAAMRAGLEDLALEGFRELTARLPAFAEGWNNLGVLLARREEYEAAARAFNQALEQMPGLEEARKNLDLINRTIRAGAPQ